MTLPGQICPNYGEYALFWCPSEDRQFAGGPHPFWEDPDGGTSSAISWSEYKVGSKDWAENRNNRRLAWGTFGSTYAVPMSTPFSMGSYPGSRWFEGGFLTQHPWFSTNGMVDRSSGDANPKALYLVDKKAGIHLYSADEVSTRHEAVNYLTFGAYVKRTTRDELIESGLRWEDPWIFNWQGAGGEADPRQPDQYPPQ